ncbi:MAG: secretin N-terminal domain-containing protein [Gemmatimonadota bacterium]|nr:secretin N-terminal domain-containing protein [Gemmatimonadota bacterium]
MRTHRMGGTVLVLLPLLLCAARGAVAQEPVKVTPQGVLLDFQDADLRFVITALAEAGDINVVYGELPQRRVTLRMKQPVSREGLRPLLKSLAQSNGLRVTETADFLRLDSGVAGGLPARDSARQPAPDVALVVYRLKHAKASQLASTLQSIFAGGRGDAATGLRSVPLSEELETRLPPAGADDSTAPTPRVDVQLGDARPFIPGQLKGQIQIVPDERTNALIVRALPADWAILKQTIEQLDIRPLQVLIEVVIAEVKRTSETGFSASGTVKDARGNPRVEGTLEDAKAARSVLLRLLSGGAVNLDLALSALASRGNVRILSRPVIMAQNNQEARILIGSERPFIQASRSLPTDAGVRDQVIQYRDVGTKLTLTPTINSDGYVNLQVLQEVSTATAEVQFGAPVISTREASTHLFIRDGQTAVIGGLIDRQQEKSKSGIPGLMDIPLLGGLFSTTRNTSSNSELFLFLTPYLIQTDDDIDRTREGIRHDAPLLRDLVPGAAPRDTTSKARQP